MSFAGDGHGAGAGTFAPQRRHDRRNLLWGFLGSVLDDRRVGYNAAFERAGRRVVNGQMEAGEGNREAAPASMLSKIMPMKVSGGGGSIGGTVRGHQRTGSSTKGGGGSVDLVMLNTENEMFALSNLMEAAAEVMGSRGIGSAYRAVLRSAIGAVVIVVVTTFLCITDDRETDHADLDWPNRLKIVLGIARRERRTSTPSSTPSTSPTAT